MNRRGYSLMELIAVFAAFGMLLNVLAGIMVANNRLSAVGLLRLDRLTAREEIAAAFHDQVQQSLSLGHESTGGCTADRLVMIAPNPEGVNGTIVSIIETYGDRVAVRKIQFNDDHREEFAYHPFQRRIESLTFEYSNPGNPNASRWVRMLVVFADDPAETVHEFTAARRVSQ